MIGAFPSGPVVVGLTGDGGPFSCREGGGLATNVNGGSVSLLPASDVATEGTARVRGKPPIET